MLLLLERGQGAEKVNTGSIGLETTKLGATTDSVPNRSRSGDGMGYRLVNGQRGRAGLGSMKWSLRRNNLLITQQTS